MRLPDFIGVGPPRTGTTWLHQVLEGHLALPRGVKETLFFNRYYSKGLKWYAHHFRDYPSDLPAGEITPAYFDSTQVRERISHDIPQCKIICTFREPVERLYSMYKLMRHYGWTQAPFERAIASHEPTIESGRYAHYLKQWQSTFGPQRVLVCLYDDLQLDPQAYLDRVTDFVGARRIDLAKSLKATARVWGFERAPRSPRLAGRAWQLNRALSRRGSYRVSNLLERIGFWQYCFGRGEPFPRLDAEVAARLREAYRPEVVEFERLIGRDLSAWKRATVRAPARAAAPADAR